MSEILLLSLVLLFLTLLSGYFSTAETAFFSLSSAKVHAWRDSADRRRRHVAWLLARSRYLLVLIFMLDNVADVFLQNTASDLFDRFGGGWFLKAGVPLFLILVFGEFLPKYLGMLWNESLAIRSATFFVKLEQLMGPIQRGVTSCAEICSRTLFFFLRPEPPLSTREVDAAIDMCKAKGILSPEEAGLITHTLSFEKKAARELMTPRSAMRTILPSQLTYSFLKHLASSPYIVPLLIVDETADRPLGVLSNNTILHFQESAVDSFVQTTSKDLFFVPESMPARRLLHEFSSKQGTIACVIDEHGSISGYIEWENVLQTILGFPSQKGAAHHLSLRPKQKSITFPGTTSLEVLNELFGTSIQSTYYATTIGGWLAEVFDAVPQNGMSYETDDLIFRILSATEKMVLHVFIQKKNGKGNFLPRSGL